MNGQAARRAVVQRILSDIRPELIVETGTFRGGTTEWFAQFGYPVVTVEINERYCEFSRLRLKHFNHVRVELGESVATLARLATQRGQQTGPIFFYLDSHWEDHLPLRDELELIFSSFAKSIVLIDDFKVDGDPDYSFDDYGPGKSLTLEYVLTSNLPKLAGFFPAAGGKSETGGKRGWIILTANAALAEALASLETLASFDEAVANWRREQSRPRELA